MKKVFIEGPILPNFIANSIAKHSSKKDIGAHSLFLGQVRADELEQKLVTAIEYTAYVEMAEEKIHIIREEIFNKYNLSCMHIYHSCGTVHAGEISLFVFTSSRHRKDAFSACEEIVNRIKTEVPIWGKEILDNATSNWKENN
ncbi:MAG: molybdenum cofactor biosynthesis protein MoaE [Saprospiraceae bacterium]